MRFAAVSVVTALLAFSACGGSTDALPEESPGPGAIVDGSVERFSQTLAEMRGRPIVVNFWATWCEPCKDEMPRLVAAARTYRGRVHFLGVDVQDDPTAAARFADAYRMPFPSMTDPQRAIVRDQKILGLPVTQFYRADGELAFVHSGEIQSDELEEKIEELIRIGQPTRESGS